MRVTLTDPEGRVTEGHQFVEAEEACACGSRLVGGTGKTAETYLKKLRRQRRRLERAIEQDAAGAEPATRGGQP